MKEKNCRRKRSSPIECRKNSPATWPNAENINILMKIVHEIESIDDHLLNIAQALRRLR